MLRTSSVRLASDPTVRLLTLFAAVAVLLWLMGLWPLLGGRATVLFPSGPNFADMLVYKGRFTLFHTAAFFTSRRYSAFAYPAGCAVLYQWLFATGNAVAVYLGFAAAITAAALTTAYRHLGAASLSRLFAPLLLLGFPMVFLVQRANVELFLFTFVAGGLLLYRRGSMYSAAVLFGLAAACKLYPLFMLGLFLKRRTEWRAFGVSVAVFVAAVCAATAFAGPSFGMAAHGFAAGVSRFQDHYVETVRSAEIRYDHCLFSPFKYWAAGSHVSLDAWLRPYYLFAGSSALLLFVRVRTMPFLNRALYLTTAMVALPPVSYTYTLVHLYLPALLLLTAPEEIRWRASACIALSLLFFLFLPLVALSGFGPLPVGAVQALAVLGLMIAALLQPWPGTAPLA